LGVVGKEPRSQGCCALRGARESWASLRKAFDPLGREKLFSSLEKERELPPQLRWSWFAIESFPKPATRRLERPQKRRGKMGFVPFEPVGRRSARASRLSAQGSCRCQDKKLFLDLT
jgi:hypothetical protein